MSRSDIVYLSDILESVTIILDYVDNKTENEFVNDIMLQDAVIRRFEIIGEASTKITENTKNTYPGIQWRLMKAMRNKLIHEYFGVSAVTIYATVKQDLPVLKQHLDDLFNP